MSESRKQLIKIITRQRRALRNHARVLNLYRREIIRLGGDPDVVKQPADER